MGEGSKKSSKVTGRQVATCRTLSLEFRQDRTAKTRVMSEKGCVGAQEKQKADWREGRRSDQTREQGCWKYSTAVRVGWDEMG